jgi:hypothetical protein
VMEAMTTREFILSSGWHAVMIYILIDWVC